MSVSDSGVKGAAGSTAPDAPFLYVGGDPAIDLVNTVDYTAHGLELERLTSYDRLTRWAEGAGIVWPKAGQRLRAVAQKRPRDAEAALRLALRVREVLARVFGAIQQGEASGDAINDFNGLLGRALEGMRIVPSRKLPAQSRGLELGWRDSDGQLASILWPVIWSAAQLIVSQEAPQLRTCCGDDCGWMYVDRSRNGLRRWCRMESCGTREKSRRRYQRSHGARPS